MKQYRLAVLMLIGFLLPGGLMAQSRWAMNLGLSAWPNNCDVPSGAQDSGTSASFGPFVSFIHGKWQFGATFFTGHFDIHPEDGLELDANNNPIFSDGNARDAGFTSDGQTTRTDVDVNFGYSFNRYAKLSLSLVLNRHTADVRTLLEATRDPVTGDIILPKDPSRSRALQYTDNQFWLGGNFSGSLPVETVSTRFSIFYNTSLLVLATESGDGKYLLGEDETLDENWEDSSSRARVIEQDGVLTLTDLGSRSFGDNFGFTLSAGAGFQLTNSPAVVLFVGYNIKFFDEVQNSFVDHSVFKGPFGGVSVNVF